MTDRITVEERAARQEAIKARLAEIDAEYSGAALPEDVRAEWDRLNAEYDEHEQAIRDDQARKERLRKLVDKPGHAERVEAPAAPAFIRTSHDIYDLSAIRNKARSFDELPGLYREHALRVVERGTFPGVERKEDAQGHVERLLTTIDDDQGTLARRVIVTGSPLYERAFGKAICGGAASLTSEEQRALSLGSDAAGGYAVPYQLDPTVILTSDGVINPLRRIARVEQIVGKEWRGITSAGITVSRAAEASEADDDSPSFTQPVVRPTRVDGFVPFSVELDQDWGALRSEITRMLAEAKEQEEADSFVNGTGSGTSPSGVVATLPAESEVAAGSATTLTSGDLYKVEEALPPRFRARARWLANKSVYNLVRQAGSASDGGDLWVRLGAGQPAELIGYPAEEMSTMATFGPSARVLLFGDFSQFIIVDRVGMSVELVPVLFGSNRRPTGQRGIFAMWRNSSLVLVPNAFRVLTIPSA